jgi:hypothetical protein
MTTAALCAPTSHAGSNGNPDLPFMKPMIHNCQQALNRVQSEMRHFHFVSGLRSFPNFVVTRFKI